MAQWMEISVKASINNMFINKVTEHKVNTWRRRKYPGVSLPSLMIMSANWVWGGLKLMQELGWFKTYGEVNLKY